MAILEREIVSEQASDGPKPYRWTRAKYEQAIARGLFGPSDRIELLEGVIVEKMPQNNRHQSAIGAMQEALTRLFPVGYWLRIQMPLAVNDFSTPEPDLAVVVGSWRDHTGGTPTGENTVLVVKISDSTLATDRRTKAALYAQAMIPEYWIVNLDERIVEVHRQPGASDDPSVLAYQEVTRVSETISPLALNGVSLSVTDILP